MGREAGAPSTWIERDLGGLEPAAGFTGNSASSAAPPTRLTLEAMRAAVAALEHRP